MPTPRHRRPGPWPSWTTLSLAGALLGLGGCGRKAEAPAPQVAAEQPVAMAPWTWHRLGNLVVIEGEVAEETDLFLEGPSIRHSRAAELGPVRWEVLRPPQGEVAQLKDGQGRILATFHFRGDSEPPAVEAPRRLAQRTAPPAPPLAAPPPSRPVAPRPASKPAPTPAAKPPAPALPTPDPTPEVRISRLTPVSPLKPGKAFTPPDLREPVRPVAAAPRPTAPEATPIPRTATPGAAPALAWPGMGEALNLTHGPRSRKALLLSFDGGSNSEGATEILDALKARGIRTTLFLTGTFVRKFPNLVRRMAAEGHELGNHTLNHPHFAPGMRRDPKWTKERIQEELLAADRALYQLLGRPMDPVWRAPYGEHNAEIRRWAEELGYRHVGWSEGADSLDWATPKERKLYRSGDAILQRLQGRLAREGEGLIVLMHLGSERDEQDRPAAKLGAFLDRARAEGWTFTTAGEMLREMGKPTWDRAPRLALLQRGGGTGAP